MYKVSPFYPHPLLDIRFAEGPSSESIVAIFISPEGQTFCAKDATALATAYLPETARKLFPNKAGQSAFIAGPNITVLLICVEPKGHTALEDLAKLGGIIVRSCRDKSIDRVYVNADRTTILLEGFEENICLRAFLQGMHSATYRMEDFKTTKASGLAPAVVEVSSDLVFKEDAPRLLALVSSLASAEHFSRRLIDLPAQPGCMETEDAVALLREIVASNEGVEGTFFVDEELRREGLNAVYSVGQGSDHRPALVALRYNGASSKTPTIALVGKYVVFDTGGEDIKPADEFANMKSDMGGGAMALAAFLTCVKLHQPVNLVLVLSIVDNAPSGKSQHPGTIIPIYHSKSVEVGNTDAEGRLILVDGIRYAEVNHKPDYLISIATLTGACVGALGHDFAGLFAKTPRMAEALKVASARSGDLVWQLPLAEARHINLEKGRAGELADVCSTGHKKVGGATTAGKFILLEHCQTKEAAHLDVAGPSVQGHDRTGEKAVFSSGYGPILLWEAIQALSGQQS